MQRNPPLLWLVGIGHVPGTNQQLFEARFSEYLIKEKSLEHQFVAALEKEQKVLPDGQFFALQEVVGRYNERIVKTRKTNHYFVQESSIDIRSTALFADCSY